MKLPDSIQALSLFEGKLRKGGDRQIERKELNDVLQYALENGMIDVKYVQEQIALNKRKELIEKHPYSIWKGKEGLWHTYLPDAEKKRIHKRSSTRQGIEDIVVDYWKEQMENPTVKDVYEQWITGKLSKEEISVATKNRYDRKFSECMEVFGRRKIKSVSEYEIEDFILNIIHEKNLTAKGYSNLRTLIYGIFKLAKKKKYIDFSITEVISDMEISRKAFQRNQQPDEALVFSEEETDQIIQYIISSQLDLINLGLLLAFKTGVRPGELAALKKEDLLDRSVDVRRTEIHYQNEDGENVYEVRDFPKTEAGIRTVLIPKQALWIVKEIKRQNPFGEYVFMKNGKRIRTYSFTWRLKSICQKLDIPVRSLNKIRKTYGTILLDSGAEESFIISQMGHTDIKTTKNYYYKDRKSMRQKIEAIDQVAGL